MSEKGRPEAVVIDPELLRHATPEERDAYRQYLLFTAIELDEWEPWLQVMVPGAASKPFAKHHAEFWRWLWSVEVDERPKPFVAIWPRGQGKSTSAEVAVLVLGCRRRRNYGLYIAETQEQADDHVANVAALLESETVEIAYPELGQRLMGKFGSAKGWRRNRVRTSTGFTLDAMGLDSAARGVKLEHQRPDFMVFDDLDSELDSELSTYKKIKTITRKLLPAGSQDCAVLMIQNMVHEDSIFARLSDGRADFLMDRIVSGPIPAIEEMKYEERDGKFVIVEGTPSWPEGMPMESCQLLMNDIGLTAFLAECQHETQPPEGDIFTHLTFARCTHAELPEFKRVTVWVDPAVTTTDRSDSMGIQCDALGRDGKFYRLYSWEMRSTPLTAIEKALKTALRWGADTVGVETDQGGDTWEVVYHQACENLRKEGLLDGRAPKFKHAKASTGHGSKIARAERMLVDYERGKFVHLEGTHHSLEQALRRFPKVKPYDLVDACYWSWADLNESLMRRRIRTRSSAKQILANSTISLR